MSADTPKPIEILFKQVDGINIYMDVYLPESATKEDPAPIVLWWHGGGLLQGTRKALSPHHLHAPSKHNICIVSPDYRLAPQFRFPAILSDCASAMTFLHSPEFASKVQGRADTSRIVLSGSSAGGWLSLLCGMGIGFDESGVERPPKIQGIAAIYPITDLQDEFWKVKKEPYVGYMGRIIKREEVEPFVNPDDAESRTAYSSLDSRRAMFYHYMVQEAIEAELLLGNTRIPETAYSVAPSLKRLLKEPGIYNLPPTFIVHGTADTKVPVEQARDVAATLEELKKGGVAVDYEYEEVEGVDHSYDKEPSCKMERMYEFLNRVFSK
ncbi:hypothetical protein D9758_012793 [Tetrapyrgos nigripes]|uniref:Alpha/beta-hydrolase n=1 Tax=Tetrapyrgos nigripes TaxID=182062 RepID=A0A8H5CYJ3_9AGAR|nr:hypothetical protein D9758_012793 [Tetrapyrgos nigripes]